MENTKRERSANFSLEERNILISLVQKYENEIETKECNATAWKMKESAWENIEMEFNAQCDGVTRSNKTLKIKYEGLKRTVRKKWAAIQAELYRTGGEPAPPLDGGEEIIKNMISLSSYDGLESIYDSDVDHQTPARKKPDKTLDNTPNEKYVPTPNDTKRVSSNSSSSSSQSSHKKWDVTNSNKLIPKKNPALTNNLQETQLDELTQAKLELLHLQKELLEAEIIEKKKEWQFKEMERKWKEEEYKLKLDKLKKELNY